MCCGEFAAKLGDVHRHDVRFTPRVHKRHLFMRFRIVDVVDGRHDNTLILDQVNGVILTYCRAGAGRRGLLLALIKLAALVVAAACGFRGGRIFPAVFVGVALGLMLHEHVDAVPAAITVSCSILGLVLVVTRDAWLSLFMAAVVVPDSTLFPLLCIVMLPAWLLLAGKPMMMAWRNDK